MSTLQKLQNMTSQDFENMTPEEIELFNLKLQIEKLERLGHDATELIKEKEDLEYRISPDIKITGHGCDVGELSEDEDEDEDDIVILN